MIPRRRVVVVGISGPSGVGKSTLAAQMSQRFQCPAKPLHLDDYILWKQKETKASDNWDPKVVVDFKTLKSDLASLKGALSGDPDVEIPAQVMSHRRTKKPFNLLYSFVGAKKISPQPVVVIVEGFVLYCDEEMANECDIRLWLEMGHDQTAARRKTRGAAKNWPPDKFRNYYDKEWKDFMRLRASQRKHGKPWFEPDAEETKDKILEQVTKY